MTAQNRIHARFPAVTFVSRAEFDNYLQANQPELDALFLYERRLASADPVFHRPGTCAPCMRPTMFRVATDGGESLSDGGIVPNWREQFSCGCGDRLGARFRATLHFLRAVVGISSRTRLLAFGPATPLDRRLRQEMPLMLAVPQASHAHGAYRVAAPDASTHLVVALDVLHQVPPLDAVLPELRRVLVPRGQLVLTVPFRSFANATVSKLDGAPLRDGVLPPMCDHEVHELGWDFLDRLRAAGFRRATAHCYRSEELGYPGPFNLIFSAEA